MKFISIISSVLLASTVSSLSLKSVYNFVRDAADISTETQQPKQAGTGSQDNSASISQGSPSNSSGQDSSQSSNNSELKDLENKIYTAIDSFLQSHPQVVSVISSLFDGDSSSSGGSSSLSGPPKSQDQSPPQSDKRELAHPISREEYNRRYGSHKNYNSKHVILNITYGFVHGTTSISPETRQLNQGDLGVQDNSAVNNQAPSPNPEPKGHIHYQNSRLCNVFYHAFKGD
ncbi:hypothetical protein K502DRAFT_363065 [Neoconidiobolus thromboides FSU 785]|nr:hypothetical protein K502DRAFT_363065 [Neoconidiobolus thromboides FSU 785]